MRRNELRGMTGGDVSHSSEIGYLHERHRPGFVLSDFISVMFSCFAFPFI
jgi:hypothetical protein